MQLNAAVARANHPPLRYYIEFGSDIDEEILKPSMLFWSPKRNHGALQIESGEGVEVVEKIHATSEHVFLVWPVSLRHATVLPQSWPKL